MIKPVQVLIVEDDPTTALLAKTMVESFGCIARVTSNGQEGVDMYLQYFYEGQAFDMVFMDLQLPVMGGFEAANEIRSFEEEKNAPLVPIIAVTGTLDSRNYSQVQQVGMNECCGKPYTLSLVERLLCLYVPHFTRNLAGKAEQGKRHLSNAV